MSNRGYTIVNLLKGDLGWDVNHFHDLRVAIPFRGANTWHKRGSFDPLFAFTTDTLNLELSRLDR